MKPRSLDEAHARRATWIDAPGIFRLQAAAMRALGLKDYDAAAAALIARELRETTVALLEAGRMHVLVSGGQIVATGGWSAEGRPGASFVAHIGALAVAPARARTGLGSRILARLEAEVEAEGGTGADIEATLTAMPLCTRRGYRPTRLLMRPLPRPGTLYGALMSKPLNCPLGTIAGCRSLTAGGGRAFPSRQNFY